MHTKITKRFALAAFCALGAAAFSSAQAETTIKLWTLLSGGDGARMKQLVDSFNASQKKRPRRNDDVEMGRAVLYEVARGRFGRRRSGPRHSAFIKAFRPGAGRRRTPHFSARTGGERHGRKRFL